MGPHERPDVVGESVAIILAAAEQQAMIRRDAEVIHDEARIRNRRAVADEVARARFAQRFGHRDEVVDRHDAPLDFGRQVPQVAVAGQHDARGLQVTRARLHAPAAVDLAQSRDFDALVQARTVALRGARDAEREIQCMQVSAACVKTAAVVVIRRNDRTHFVALDIADVPVAVGAAQVLDMRSCFRAVAFAVICVQVSEPQVTVDAIGFDQPVEVCTRIERELPQPPRVILAHARFEPRLVAAHADVRLSAVATRCAPTQSRLLEQSDSDAPAREVKGR